MNEAMQQKYAEYQQLSNQLQQVQQQILQLEQQAMELNTLLEAITDVGKAKEGSEVLAPLGSGIYVKTSLAKNDELVMHIGSRTHVTKNPEDAKEIIKNQQDELKKIIVDMKVQFQNGVLRVQHLQKELTKAQQQA